MNTTEKQNAVYRISHLFNDNNSSAIIAKKSKQIISEYEQKKAVLKAHFALNPCEKVLKQYIDLELDLKASLKKLREY